MEQEQPDLTAIHGDIQGLVAVAAHGLHCAKLDLILVAPGGSFEATEAFVYC
jgi:hypothetical protein